MKRFGEGLAFKADRLFHDSRLESNEEELKKGARPESRHLHVRETHAREDLQAPSEHTMVKPRIRTCLHELEFVQFGRVLD